MKATKEKAPTLEMPLNDLEEIQELWRDVGAFHQVLIKLAEGDAEVYDSLLRLFNPIYERFGDLMAGKPNLDQRIFDAGDGKSKAKEGGAG